MIYIKYDYIHTYYDTVPIMYTKLPESGVLCGNITEFGIPVSHKEHYINTNINIYTPDLF